MEWISLEMVKYQLLDKQFDQMSDSNIAMYLFLCKSIGVESMSQRMWILIY